MLRLLLALMQCRCLDMVCLTWGGHQLLFVRHVSVGIVVCMARSPLACVGIFGWGFRGCSLGGRRRVATSIGWSWLGLLVQFLLWCVLSLRWSWIRFVHCTTWCRLGLRVLLVRIGRLWGWFFSFQCLKGTLCWQEIGFFGAPLTRNGWVASNIEKQGFRIWNMQSMFLV